MARDEHADKVHASSKIGKVQLSDLQVDSSYQRTPSAKLVEEIEQNWDVVASELLLVSDRGERPEDGPVGGGLFLVNGQHRSIAARRLGLKSLDARIIDMTAEEDPASIESKFRLKTNVGLRDSATERFKARLRAGDAEAIEIVKILAKCGTEIQFNPADEFGLRAVTSVEQIYNHDVTGALLRETLELTRDSFGGYTDKAGSASMLKAIAWFIVVHYDQIDRSRVVTQLSAIQSAAIDRRARTFQGSLGGGLWFNYYRALVDAYNERLQDRNKLEWVSRGAKSLSGSTWGGVGRKGLGVDD